MEIQQLIKSILETKIELENANINFESAEAEMIDYYSYQIKANKSKFDYLIRKIKHYKINIDMIKRTQLGNNSKKAI